MDKKKLNVEWNALMKNHPEFARTFLAQQAILMQASLEGNRQLTVNMCEILKAGLPVLFEAFWKAQCEQVVGHVEFGGLLGCLSEGNRDPSRCFGSDEDGWFDDPFAGGQTLPPIGPSPFE